MVGAPSLRTQAKRLRLLHPMWRCRPRPMMWPRLSKWRISRRRRQNPLPRSPRSERRGDVRPRRPKPRHRRADVARQRPAPKKVRLLQPMGRVVTRPLKSPNAALPLACSRNRNRSRTRRHKLRAATGPSPLLKWRSRYRKRPALMLPTQVRRAVGASERLAKTKTNQDRWALDLSSRKRRDRAHQASRPERRGIPQIYVKDPRDRAATQMGPLPRGGPARDRRFSCAPLRRHLRKERPTTLTLPCKFSEVTTNS